LKASALTGELLFGGLLAAGIYDYAAYRLWGNGATISYWLLGLSKPHPFFGMIVMYALNELAAHLTEPTYAPELPTWREFTNIGIALAPVATGLVYIAIDVEHAARFARALHATAEAPAYWRWAAIQLGVAVLGQLAGLFLVPQHAGTTS
jgi:hypothetical protein